MAALLQKEKVFLIGVALFLQCLSENIGEFSQCHYSMWDEKCPAKNRFMLIKFFSSDNPPEPLQGFLLL